MGGTHEPPTDSDTANSAGRDAGTGNPWIGEDRGFAELLERVQWLIDAVAKASPVVLSRVSGFIADNMPDDEAQTGRWTQARGAADGFFNSNQWLQDIVEQLVDRHAAAAWLGALRAELPGLFAGVPSATGVTGELVDLLDTIVARLLDGSNTPSSMVDAIVLPIFDRLSAAFIGTAMQDMNIGDGVPSTKADHDID